jgi:NTE family protein
MGEIRRGVVLGAGGTLGAAWMIARLRSLEMQHGFDAREVELLVGSSAGAVLATMIACGVSVQDLLDHQRGEAGPLNPLAKAGYDHDSSVGGSLPERPKLRVGSGRLLAQVARHPVRLGALTAVAAALPPGRGSLAGLRAAVEEAVGGRKDWPEHPLLLVTALDYRTGERLAFGAPGSPRAPLVDAVIASCSIPGWFAPTVVDGRPYIDAGFRQATSADLACGRGLDQVFVLSPLASYAVEPRPSTSLARLERRWRRHLTAVLEREVAPLTAEGVAVSVLTPTAEERVAMGANLMDHRRRTRVLDIALARTSDEPPPAEP